MHCKQNEEKMQTIIDNLEADKRQLVRNATQQEEQILSLKTEVTALCEMTKGIEEKSKVNIIKIEGI